MTLFVACVRGSTVMERKSVGSTAMERKLDDALCCMRASLNTEAASCLVAPGREKCT